MGQVENAIDRARRNIVGKDGPWRFDALKVDGGKEIGTLYRYGTPIFRVDLKTGRGEVGQGAWGSVSDQTGIRKAAAHLSKVLGGRITVSALSKKEILEKRDRARAKGQAFSNPSGLPTKRTGAYRLDAGHAHIGKGLVYCEASRDSAPPLLSHSRVRCALCGKTVSSMHNPPRLFAWIPGGWKQEGASLGRSRAVNDAVTKAERHSVTENPARRAQFIYKKFLISKDWESGLFKVIHRGEVLYQAKSAKEAKGAVDRVVAGRSVFYKSPPWKSNPAVGRNSPTLIYGRAKSLTFDRNGHITQMTARKTEGPYKGENFVHDFKPGVRHIGLPRGTEVTAPGGRSMKIKTRAALMVGPRDIWRNFAA